MAGQAFRLSTATVTRISRGIVRMAAASKMPVPAGVVPSRADLARVIEAVHWASVITDERRFPRFAVSFGPPDDKNAPVRVKRAPLSPDILAAMAPAALKEICQIGVSSSDKGLEVWGFNVGQTTRVVVRALDPARVSIALGPETLGVVEHGKTHDLTQWDPYAKRWHGLSRGHLAKMVSSFFETNVKDEHDRAALGAILVLLVYAIRQQGHGGTLLLLQPGSRDWIGSGRLAHAHVGLSHTLKGLRKVLDRKLEPWDAINRSPIGPFFTGRRMVDIHTAVRDSVNAIGTLTGVDGAVTLEPSLRLRGFGAVIRPPKGAKARFDILRRTIPTPSSFEKQDLRTLKGTRRQTAALFVRNNYDTVAFVVSHDGPVRLVAWGKHSGKNKALMLDGVELMLD